MLRRDLGRGKPRHYNDLRGQRRALKTWQMLP